MALKQAIQYLWRGKSGSPYSGTSGPGPMPTVDLFRKQRPPTAFELVQENVNTAYACAELNSNAVAKTPLRLYLQTRRGESRSKISKRGDTEKVSTKTLRRLKNSQGMGLAKAQDVEEVLDHPLLDLLNNPNPDGEDGVGMTLVQLLDYTQVYQEVVGRCYWWTPLDGFGGRPSAIWLLAAQFVTEITDRSGKNVVDWYSFGAGVQKMQYQPQEITPFRCKDLNNPYLGGISPMRAVFEKTRLNRKVDARSNALLSNGGMPTSLYVPTANESTGGLFDKTLVKRLQAKINAMFTLAQGRMMVAERAGTVIPLEWPMRDIADFQVLEMSRTDIANGYGVPMGMLDPQEQNLTAIQAAKTMHAENAVEPRLRRNEGAINLNLVRKYDDTRRLFFAYDSSVPGDGKETREDSKTLLAGNSITRNELRQRHGLEPDESPDGDEYMKTGGGGAGDDEDDDNGGPDKRASSKKALRRELLSRGYLPEEID